MLITHDPQQRLRARPMAIASVEDPDVMWFVTRIEAGKVDEIRKDERVAVALQGTTRFASITGTAEVMVDASRIEALWNDTWRLWFPEGQGGPIALVRVKADLAEVWDASGLNAVSFALEAGRALVEGEKMGSGAGEHRTIAF
jgi:general stress protein 26